MDKNKSRLREYSKGLDWSRTKKNPQKRKRNPKNLRTNYQKKRNNKFPKKKTFPTLRQRIKKDLNLKEEKPALTLKTHMNLRHDHRAAKFQFKKLWTKRSIKAKLSSLPIQPKEDKFLPTFKKGEMKKCTKLSLMANRKIPNLKKEPWDHDQKNDFYDKFYLNSYLISILYWFIIEEAMRIKKI